MSRFRLLCCLLCLGWVLPLVSYAQPTLLTERRNVKPFRPYAYNLKSFELPGHRFVHCGYTILPTKYELTLVVSKATGDTVRYRRLNRNPLRGADGFTDAVLEPDYSLTYLSKNSVSGALPTDPALQAYSLTQLDTLGQVRWQRFFPLYPRTTVLDAYALLRVPDGYLVTLSFYSPVSSSTAVYPQAGLAKLDLQGNLLWQHTWPSRGYGGVSLLNGLVARPDGSYLAVGYTDNGAPYTGGAATPRGDYYLVQFTPQGDTIRTVRFGVNGLFDGGNQLASTRDGGIVVSGMARTTSPSYNNAQVVKLDSLLRVQWTYTQPNTSNDGEAFNFVQPTTRGDILVGGGIYVVATRRIYATLTSFRPSGLPRWSYQHNFANDLLRPTSFTTLLCQPDSSAYLAGETRATQPSTVGEDAFFHLGNVGAAFVPDLCRTPPLANLAFIRSATGDSLRLLNFSQPGPRYAQLARWHWDFGDGTSYDGPTPPTHHYPNGLGAATHVQLTVTNNLGCTNAQIVFPFALATAPAREQATRTRLYPNPTAGDVTLDVPRWAGSGPVAVQVLDRLGRVVLTQVVRPVAGVLRVALAADALPAGVYAVRVPSPVGIITKRLVRQ